MFERIDSFMNNVLVWIELILKVSMLEQISLLPLMCRFWLMFWWPMNMSIEMGNEEPNGREKCDTCIGSNCTIGQNSIIKGCVRISDDCIVDLESVVTKDILSCEIWEGNLVRKIKDRFEIERE